MLALFGKLSLSLSLLLSFSVMMLGWTAGARKDYKLKSWLPKLYYLLALSVGISSVILLLALLSSDFSIRYVWMYTNKTLEPAYKLSAFWGGQEGSMLFWCLVLALTTAAAVSWMQRRWRESPPERLYFAIATFATVLCFFHIVMFFAENPFAEISAVQFDGRGLNPLLQTWSMIVHPPCLYLGFILCTIPFAIAVATLMSGQMDARAIRETRLWTILAWFFLSAGNLLGANWAYTELGWGGFWAWDPVENAAIMPWFTTTAFLHSIMVQERRGLLKSWNFVLVSISFCLTILGTFITRSGLISSVHTFAKSNLGYFFLIFLLLIIGFCAVVTWRFRRELKSDGAIDELFAKETAFVLNNILLTIAAFAILWGTLFPIFSEWITGKKITVGPPFFNSFMVPIGLALLFLMGMGQTMAWRATEVWRLVKLLTWPIVGSLLAAILCLITTADWGRVSLYTTLSFSLMAFVLISLLQEFGRGMQARRKANRENYLLALIYLTLAARRRYGGYIVHFGLLLVFLGITGIAFKEEQEVVMIKGETRTIAGYTITFRGIEVVPDPHKEAVYATLNIIDGKRAYTLKPARFFYRSAMQGEENIGNSGEPQVSTEVAIDSNWRRDVYTVLHTFNLQNHSATMMFTINPLVNWLWWGGWVMVLGTAILLTPKRWSKEGVSAAENDKLTLMQSIKEIDFDLKTGKMSVATHQNLRQSLVDNIVALGTFCAHCGRPCKPTDHFCGGCGKKV